MTSNFFSPHGRPQAGDLRSAPADGRSGGELEKQLPRSARVAAGAAVLGVLTDPRQRYV